MFENIDWAMLIGQIFGGIAVILGFINYQTKSSKTILIINMITCGVFCVHYLLIGAISGFALNSIGMIRNIVYTNRDKKVFASPVWPFVFALIMLIAGIMTWQDWRSILMIGGLLVNSLGLSLKKAQHIRYTLMISCPLVLAYDLLVHSYGGIVYESMAIISALIGIFRYRNAKQESV